MTKRRLIVGIVMDAVFLLVSTLLALFLTDSTFWGFVLGMIAGSSAQELAIEIKSLRRLLREEKEQPA